MPAPEGFPPLQRPPRRTGHGWHDLLGCCVVDGHGEEFFEPVLVYLLQFHPTDHVGSPPLWALTPLLILMPGLVSRQRFSAGPPGDRDRRGRRDRSAHGGDQAAGPAGAVPGGDVRDEVEEPRWRVGEVFAEVFAADEGPARVLLPAGRAQPEPGVRSELSAFAAGSWRVIG
jgi:hypothetical protein